VVRSMARSDHWRWVSIPNCARHSSKVTSRLHRLIKSQTICSGVWVGSVEKSTFEGRLPAGSRVRTQRMGKGSKPERYHNAVPLQISRERAPCPYQSRVSFCQTVSLSCKTCSSEGRAFSFTRFPLKVCQGAFVSLPWDIHRNSAFAWQHFSHRENP
jgi:hypothetical protein